MIDLIMSVFSFSFCAEARIEFDFCCLYKWFGIILWICENMIWETNKQLMWFIAKKVRERIERERGRKKRSSMTNITYDVINLLEPLEVIIVDLIYHKSTDFIVHGVIGVKVMMKFNLVNGSKDCKHNWACHIQSSFFNDTSG